MSGDRIFDAEPPLRWGQMVLDRLKPCAPDEGANPTKDGCFSRPFRKISELMHLNVCETRAISYIYLKITPYASKFYP